jgi:SAM-dependent methyltransferase
MNVDIISYYKNRAAEYEKIYSKPERQNDLLQAAQILQKTFADKDVFEIACGTGYWTKKISATAKIIVATDINDAVIEIAKSKDYLPAKVNFQTADIFNLKSNINYNNLFGGFIWSHIKIEEIPDFIDIVNDTVETNGTVVFMDNRYVDGSSLPITATDGSGNTFQTRKLENGETYEVLKNFPTETFVRQQLAEKAKDIAFIKLQYFWILTYTKI